MSNNTFSVIHDVDNDPGFHTLCDCGSVDSVVEVDNAIRFNTLEIDDEGTVVADLGETGDFDFDHWFCTSCLERVEAPDDFEISDWV